MGPGGTPGQLAPGLGSDWLGGLCTNPTKNEHSCSTNILSLLYIYTHTCYSSS
jgi:hypothetical protein